MKEIKFRYVFRKPNGHIIKYFTDIQHLEQDDIALFLERNLLALERDLISRDLYIGILDKKDKELYEGDIANVPIWVGLEHSDWVRKDFIAKIMWSNSTSSFIFQELTDCKPLVFDLSTGRIEEDEIEILGNIYENLELLKEE